MTLKVQCPCAPILRHNYAKKLSVMLKRWQDITWAALLNMESVLVLHLSAKVMLTLDMNPEGPPCAHFSPVIGQQLKFEQDISWTALINME